MSETGAVVHTFPGGYVDEANKWVREKDWSVTFEEGTPFYVLENFLNNQLSGVCQKHFKIGDTYNWMMEHCPDEVFQLFDRVDYEEGTIRNDAWVARSIPPKQRGGIKYWSHYQEIASIKDPVERESLLELASKGEITGEDIREYKREAEGGEGGEVFPLCPVCGEGHVPEHMVDQIREAMKGAELDTSPW